MNGKLWKFGLLLATVLFCCIVVSCSKEKTINGHEYVDLGLSVKWATCNVGASSPEDYGDYFPWGWTSPNSYNSAPSKSDIAGDPNYDAATANWGSPWRLPTSKEIQELRDNCILEWTMLNGINGLFVTSKINGNSIFLPAAGNSLGDVGKYGYYWSSVSCDWRTRTKYDLRFSGNWTYNWTQFATYKPHSVRPVSDD